MLFLGTITVAIGYALPWHYLVAAGEGHPHICSTGLAPAQTPAELKLLLGGIQRLVHSQPPGGFFLACNSPVAEGSCLGYPLHGVFPTGLRHSSRITLVPCDSWKAPSPNDKVRG